MKIFNLKEGEEIHSVKNFIQNFSFFTYYQYLQNDLCTSLTGLVQYQNISLREDYIKIIASSIYNYIQALNGIFKEEKIFLKILPNFLTFISQCAILINNKIKETEQLIEKNKNINTETIDNFKKYKEIYNTYFCKDGEFYINIINDVYEKENFLINNEKQKKEFKNMLITLLNSLLNL